MYSGGAWIGDRYVIEKYRSDFRGPDPSRRARAAEGGGAVAAGGASSQAWLRSRSCGPERDEIIVCTALNLKASGIQYWGSAAAGFLATRYAR